MKNAEEKLAKNIKDKLSEFGKLNSVFVKVDKTKRAPFALVCFEDDEEAEKA